MYFQSQVCSWRDTPHKNSASNGATSKHTELNQRQKKAKDARGENAQLKYFAKKKKNRNNTYNTFKRHR